MHTNAKHIYLYIHIYITINLIDYNTFYMI